MIGRKKILIIENSIAITGSLHAALRTSIALRDKYDFVFVLPLKSKAADLVKENHFQVHELPLYEISKQWLSLLLYVPRLFRSAWLVRKIMRSENVSIVHVNDFYNLIMPLWRLFGGMHRYACYVNFVPDRFPAILRWIWINSHLLFASKIIAVSQYVLKQLPTNNKVICIPDALPGEEIDNNIIQKKNVLLFLGNFIVGKGQDVAIKAFAAIAKEYPDWKLRFVGGDMGLEKNKAYRSELNTMAIELGIAAQVEMSGFAKDVAKEYREAEIALNFSVSESFSLTVQEAMFYGCSVIATRSGGPAELIDDRHSGLLVPPGDIAQMTLAIKFLITNPAERERLRVNAAQSIREKYAKSKTIDLLDQAYQDIIGLGR